MSIAAGVFSETSLVDIQVKIDEIWADAIQKQDYVANVDVVKAIIANQTAVISDLKGYKDRTVDIGWINACEIDDQACQVCTIDGDELSTNIAEKTLTTCREAPFKVEEGVFRSNMFDHEEVIAKGFLAAAQRLDEYWAAAAVAFLNAAAGSNAVTTGKGTVAAGGDTYVIPGFWDAGLMAYMNRVAIGNRFVNPYLVSGNNLYEQVWNAKYERGQAGDESKVLKFGSLPIYFDLFNIDAVNGEDIVTYMLHRGAAAFVTKNYYNKRVEGMDEHRWSMPSKNLPGVRYDVHYKNNCDAQGDTDAFTHQFKLVTYGDYFINPTGCTDTRTGVLRFICGEES